MRKIIKFAIMLLVIFGLGSFINASFNIREWGLVFRASLTFISIILVGFYYIAFESSSEE